MKKKFTFLMTAMAMIFAIIGPRSVAWGQTKITTLAGITSGNQYYIGATTSSTDYYFYVDGSTTTNSIAGTAKTDKNDAVVLTFMAVEGGWTIQFASGNYLGLKDGKDNGKVQILADAATWTIEEVSNSNLLKLRANDNYSLQKNNSGAQFGSYGNTQTNVWLEAAGASTDPVINVDDVELAYDATSGEIPYSITNPNPEASFGVETFASWISNFTIYDDRVTFDTEANTEPTSRNATITFNYTGATDIVVTVTQAAAPQEGVLFYESFDTNDGTGGNDGQWSGSIASNTFKSDNSEWTVSNASGANKCAKFGTGSKKGTAQTPEILLSGDATLTFKAAAWDGSSEGTTLNISATNCTLSQASITLVKGAWTEYSINITNATDNIKIKFEAVNASNNRFFLDEVKVVEAEAPSVATPTFSPADGTYDEPIEVTIECATEGATIYYTTDGTTPTNESTEYTSEIEISETTTIKAIAYRNGEASNIATAEYEIVELYTITTYIYLSDYGSVETSPADRAAAGTEVTIIASPIEHYHVGTITVTDENWNGVPVEDGKFTMPASSVYISVMFEEDTQYSITYYYNGVFHHNSNWMYVGPVGPLFNPEDMTPPAGFSFVGWSTSMAITDPIDENYIITDFTNLYAIFEKASTSRENGEDSFVKVTTAPEDWSGEYLLVYEGDNDAYIWTGEDAISCYVSATITANTISTPEDAATISIEPIDGGYSIRVNSDNDNNGKYIKGKLKNGEADNGLVFDEEPSANTISVENNAIKIVNTTASQVLRFNSTANQERFRFYKPTTTGSTYNLVQLYKKQGIESAANRRYTRVYDDAYPASGLELIVEGPSIVVSGHILDVTLVHNDNADNLILEDGAQLKAWFDALATVQKNITGYGEDNVQTRDGYYLIANPTATVANDEYDALDGCAQFDLYTFNPAAALEWVNLGNTSQRVTFERNVGYLFAVPSDRTMSFRGSLLPTDEITEITLVKAEAGEGIDFPGFNLIGNPYTCNAYLNKPAYVLNENGDDFVSIEAGTPIAPCEGFFVEATEAGQSVNISTEAPEAPASLLSLTVNQNRGSVIDRAIVNFNGNNDLHKFMMNPAHTNIRLAKNGEEFAALSTEAEGELPVNFKAEKNGSYTITVNTENVEANYLHLIDNLTGMDTDLLSTPSYTFNATTSDYASRFKLVFSMNDVESNQVEASNFAYINNGEIVISNEGRATLQVIDVMGRIVRNQQIEGDARISTEGMVAGVYVLNLNGNVQKIVVR